MHRVRFRGGWQSALAMREQKKPRLSIVSNGDPCHSNHITTKISEHANLSTVFPGNVVILHDYGALIPGTLIQRYKRFLGDVRLSGALNNHVTAVHVPNTGAMAGLLDSLPAPALLSKSNSSTRKYPHTLEWIQPDEKSPYVGVHSAKANSMVRKLLESGVLQDILPYESLRAEMRLSKESRVDFELTAQGGEQCFVDVKSVTLTGKTVEVGCNNMVHSLFLTCMLLLKEARTLPIFVSPCFWTPPFVLQGDTIALFPDTVSVRAQRQMKDLLSVVKSGGRGAIVYLVQRSDCCAGFAPCHEKDPEYGRLVVEAVEAGVKVIPVACELDLESSKVVYRGMLPFLPDYKGTVAQKNNSPTI